MDTDLLIKVLLWDRYVSEMHTFVTWKDLRNGTNYAQTFDEWLAEQVDAVSND